MPKFNCKCGAILKLSNDEGGFKYQLIQEKTIDTITENLSTKSNFDDEGFCDLIVNEGISTYICPSCSRIYIENAGRNKFTCYNIEID
jgi:hypothetical protein